jgi:hypothetical protein
LTPARWFEDDFEDETLYDAGLMKTAISTKGHSVQSENILIALAHSVGGMFQLNPDSVRPDRFCLKGEFKVKSYEVTETASGIVTLTIHVTLLDRPAAMIHQNSVSYAFTKGSEEWFDIDKLELECKRHLDKVLP